MYDAGLDVIPKPIDQFGLSGFGEFKYELPSPPAPLPKGEGRPQYGSVKIAYTVNGEAIGTKPA
jgi:hypothetical protein